MTTKKTPVHQWTHDGERVMFVKCLGPDGATYGGFVWPKSGPVDIPGSPDRSEKCTAGKVYGWPWGTSLGDGAECNATNPWLVFSARPENVINLGGKCGVVVGEDGDRPVVEHYGDMASVMGYIGLGRICFIFNKSCGESATSGDGSSAATSGDDSSAATSGDGSSAATSGYRSSAATSGYGSAGQTVGESTTIELGKKCVGSVMAIDGVCIWKVHTGAVLLVAWPNKEETAIDHKCFDSSAMGLKEGSTYKIVRGDIKEVGNR